ncbi:hypothetical protein BRPE64_ACDS03650 [Caballeronia insecticola]|uniref:Uncharacterized protein n=1 Tax=Caballeronia insecticola TaxID=758793 RepID=R4WF89_9BURK|nr:hypothetical protein BRPE64_ACDS03650 [Caballeronia insecticola]
MPRDGRRNETALPPVNTVTYLAAGIARGLFRFVAHASTVACVE